MGTSDNPISVSLPQNLAPTLVRSMLLGRTDLPGYSLRIGKLAVKHYTITIQQCIIIQKNTAQLHKADSTKAGRFDRKPTGRTSTSSTRTAC